MSRIVVRAAELVMAGVLVLSPAAAHADGPTSQLPETGAGTAVPLTVGTVATATGVALLLVRKRHPRR
jgi:LPXTG-motif cell wall-anchored protein